MSDSSHGPPQPDSGATHWYAEVTRYQWLVLAIACAGWIFDVFEGQLFAVYKTPAMRELLGEQATAAVIDRASSQALAAFLAGGSIGGLIFGVLADRVGRRATMVYSILFYSVFSGLHYFATDIWHIIALRFLVAVGVGGEWAVAAALVSEEFPRRARAAAGGIFHASSVLGGALASLCGILLDPGDWRTAFLIGLTPALLILWVRSSLKESERWQESRKDQSRATGLIELFRDRQARVRALLGLALAMVGLGTYWATFVWGPELVHEVLGPSVPAEVRSQKANFAYLLMNFCGALLGLLSFAPLASWLDRRRAFAIYHIGAALLVPAAFLGAHSWISAVVLLVGMSFFVVGMHAGYAIYFPELFPTHLRATGASFCFNGGRIGSALILLVRGQMRESLGLRQTVALTAVLFLVGLAVLWFTPETKHEDT